MAWRVGAAAGERLDVIDDVSKTAMPEAGLRLERVFRCFIALEAAVGIACNNGAGRCLGGGGGFDKGLLSRNDA
jgi:hypothetical protein